MRELIARLRGEPIGLLSYEDVRQRLKASSQRDRGLHDIPMNAIVGSVGRYNDFTREFLPREEVDPHRWARIKIAASSLTGLPPIEVYQIGEVYFVKDGNHRVSVARESSASHIQAYVTEIQSEAPLTPNLHPDDLILKVEYTEFLRWSNLHKILPGVALTLTAPGSYEDLKEHINVHRYYMGLDQERDISLDEAVINWYETVYLPVVDTINRLGVLRDFPERTETDLYLWIAEHRADLQRELGWDVEAAAAASDLSTEFSEKADRVLARLGGRLTSALTPESLGLGTAATGEWREKRQALYGRDPQHLFHNILVSLDGRESGWLALDQAFQLAQREQGRILGLHILADTDDLDGERTGELVESFRARCEAAQVSGELAISTGSVAHEIGIRARWADLVVAPLSFPPGAGPIAKLRSGFRTMIVRSPSPVLAVPRALFPLSTALLAYDGSPKSREALFVAAYLVTNWREMQLVVLTVHPDESFVERNLADARAYLEMRGVSAVTVGLQVADIGAAIRDTAADHHSSLIIMGGYGFSPVVEMMLGSTVDDVLRTTCCATLICR